MFQRTTAINKLLKLKKRKKVIQGGTWAGKTYGIMAVIIDNLLANADEHYTIVAETIPAIKKGALKDFKEIMMETNRWHDEYYNATDRMYKFQSGSIIEFNAYDTVGKAQAAGKRTGLFINEAPYVSHEIANALIMRTSDIVWIDFNPTLEFWAHKEIVPQEDSEFIKLNYKDNEALPQSILDELMDRVERAKTSDYWSNWCKVYVDGEIGRLDGVVFDNWATIDRIDKDANLVGYGMDFGYSNDPTTLIACYELDNSYIWDEVIYQKGMLNSDIVNRMKDLEVNREIFADSADPKSIKEISLHGFRIKGAKKGRDSINFGLQLLQEKPFKVTSRSTNLINELRSYRWDKDRDGNTVNKPIDAFNHGIDAMRYLAVMKMKKKGTTSYSFSK
mgnify:CR=1 FL=1